MTFIENSSVIRVDKERITNILRDLVQIDSQVINQGVNGNEYTIQMYIAQFLDNLGCDVEVFEPDPKLIEGLNGFIPGHNYGGRPNVVGILKGKGGGRSIILNGHVDTMPPGDESQWKYGPWSAHIEGDRIYGLGAADMKGGLASILAAVEYIIRSEVTHCGDIIVQCVVDEEGGGNGTLACIQRGYAADGVVVCEPTCLDIQPVHMGTDLFEISVTGKSVHASKHETGVNAIDKAIVIMNGLKELEHNLRCKSHHPLLPLPSIVCGMIHGGLAASIIPDRCIMGYDVHYLPENEASIRQEIESCLKTLADQDSWLKTHPPNIHWLTRVEPMETSISSDLVIIFESVARKLLGSAHLSGMVSGCDGRLYSKIMGIPTVIFGPGSLEQAHSVNEWVSLEEVVKATSVLVSFLLAWTCAA